MSREADIQSLVDSLENTLPRVDILVNNAGVTWGAPSLDYPMEAWDKVYNINVRGLWQLSQSVAPRHERARRRYHHQRHVCWGL